MSTLAHLFVLVKTLLDALTHSAMMQNNFALSHFSNFCWRYDSPSYGAPVAAEYGAPSSAYGAGVHSYGDEYRSLDQPGLHFAAAISPIVNRLNWAEIAKKVVFIYLIAIVVIIVSVMIFVLNRVGEAAANLIQ